MLVNYYVMSAQRFALNIVEYSGLEGEDEMS